MNVWIILAKMVFVSIMREVFNVNVSKDIIMIQMEFVLTLMNVKRYIIIYHPESYDFLYLFIPLKGPDEGGGQGRDDVSSEA